MLDSTFQNGCKLVDMQRISQALASIGIEHDVIAAQPLAAHANMLLYHGTDEAHAKDILKRGILVGRLTQGRAQQAPRAGYVYVSKDIMYAAGYAGAYTQWGNGCRAERRNGAEKFTAYVFVVDTAAAGDIIVDEDVLGEYGTSTRAYPDVPATLLDYLRYAARMCATPRQLQRAKQGEMVAQSAIGKKMQTFIPNTKMLALVDACPHLALHHTNGIPVIGYYTLHESVTTPEQFKAVAKYHPISVVACTTDQVVALRSPMFQTPAKLNRQKREIPTRSSGDIVDPQEFVRHGRNGMNFTQTHDTLLANGYSNKEATMLCNIRNWADCDEH